MSLKKMGRPAKEIGKEQFEFLCSIMCTEEEIAGVFRCSVDTVARWCQKTYGVTFADIYKLLSANGKMSIRRAQFRMAEKSPAMAIWLGKQYLGQKEMVEQTIVGTTEEIMSEIAEEIKRVKENDRKA